MEFIYGCCSFGLGADDLCIHDLMATLHKQLTGRMVIQQPQ